MLIEAKVDNEAARHAVVVATQGKARALDIAPRVEGRGSSVNGGELLCLALATCYCNDLYREARKHSIDVLRVEVEAKAEFGEPGAPASRLAYRVRVRARATDAQIRALIVHTDGVAEVQNTLRRGMPVLLEAFAAEPADA